MKKCTQEIHNQLLTNALILPSPSSGSSALLPIVQPLPLPLLLCATTAAMCIHCGSFPSHCVLTEILLMLLEHITLNTIWHAMQCNAMQCNSMQCNAMPIPSLMLLTHITLNNICQILAIVVHANGTWYLVLAHLGKVSLDPAHATCTIELNYGDVKTLQHRRLTILNLKK